MIHDIICLSPLFRVLNGFSFVSSPSCYPVQLTCALNGLYRKFVRRNPNFNGKVRDPY